MCAGVSQQASTIELSSPPCKNSCSGQDRAAKRQKKPVKKPLPSLMLTSEATSARAGSVTVCERPPSAVPCAPKRDAKLWEASCVLNEDSRLYLGSAADALNQDAMRHHRITHVVNVTPDCPFLVSTLPDYKSPEGLRIPVRDHCDAPLRQYFLIAAEFIQKVREQGGNVLIHCKSGISRSSTIAAAYVMVYKGYTSEQAFEYLRSIRPEVSPNIGFLLSLEAFQKEAHALNTILSSTSYPSVAIALYYNRKVNRLNVLRKAARKHAKSKPAPLCTETPSSSDDSSDADSDSSLSFFILASTPTAASPAPCLYEARSSMSSGDCLVEICCQ